MINPIETAEPTTAQASAKPATSKPTTRGTSFAAALDRASTSVRDVTKPRDGKYGQIDAPEGERWRPVKGDDAYAHIVSGPRKGMLINLSHGARRGELFRVEQRDGHRVHVYGEGENEKVVLASKDSGRVNRHDHADKDVRAARKRPPNETWAPVPGHSGCVDILSGPRNGYFLNTSGNERDGMVFHMVFRHGREYHIYGSGKDRQVILVRHPHEPKPQRGDTGGASPS